MCSSLSALLVLLLVPGGLGAMFGDARDGALRWYARRKGIRVPSLVADTRVEPDIAAAPLKDLLADVAERGDLEVLPQT